MILEKIACLLSFTEMDASGRYLTAQPHTDSREEKVEKVIAGERIWRTAIWHNTATAKH